MPFTASKADERVLGGLIRGIGAGDACARLFV